MVLNPEMTLRQARSKTGRRLHMVPLLTEEPPLVADIDTDFWWAFEKGVSEFALSHHLRRAKRSSTEGDVLGRFYE